MKYKVLLFDADGVVLKEARLFSEQLEIDYGIRTEILQPFFHGVFRECSVGRADLREELGRVVDEWGWQGTVEDLMRYWFEKGTCVDQEVLEYVWSLNRAGARCFMVTDQEKYRGEYLRKLLGGGQPFEQVFYSAEIGYRKKDPGYFEYVYRTINRPDDPIAKDQVLLVDDGKENIAIAKTFGFDAYLYDDLRGLGELLTNTSRGIY